MAYQIAQLNIAKFIKPADHPDNAEFVNSLDRVNAVAERQQGFIWRFTGSGNDALDVQAFEDPNIVVNMSVWTDLESLASFVYRNEEHISIMRRRREWFSTVEFRLVLWWVSEGHTPTLDEAKSRLACLRDKGPTEHAFTFRHPFPDPGGNKPDPTLDECA